MEACPSLPSLPDLLDELDTEVDISSLEQLTQTLLQDIARDLEAAAQKADCEVSTFCRFVGVVDQYKFAFGAAIFDCLDCTIRCC